MGENQSKPVPDNGNQRPLIGGNNSSSPQRQYQTSHSLSNQHQQEQLSPEDVRRTRLARMEKQDYVPDRGAPKDIKSHPLSTEFGSNAYIVHINLEDLYQNTFHSSSLSRNPRLRLLQPAEKSDEIRLYTLDNMDEVIMKLLKSETYYPGSERLVFLSNLYGRLAAKDQEGLFAAEKLQELRENVFSSLLYYLLNPSTFDSRITLEDPRNLKDCSSSVYDALYTRLSSGNTDEFMEIFMSNLPAKHYDAILTPLFKRMIRDCSDTNISGRYNIQKAIVLLQNLLQIAPKTAIFFFNHELFIPKNPDPTGLDYQKNTIFGAFLSFTLINNDSPSVKEFLGTPEMIDLIPASIQAMRDKVHESINAFHRLIEAIIKLDPTKYKRHILDWISGVLISNQAMKNQDEIKSQLATHGWFCNFFVLLLKLCQKMLDDPSKYPTWLTKIELNYIFDKPLFEGESLLNGQSVPKKDSIDGSESQYSFLTELIFLTSNAWLLIKDVIQGFNLNGDKVRNLINHSSPESLRNLTSAQIDILRPSYAYLLQLMDPYVTKQLHKLMNFTALLILHSYDVKVQGLDNISSLFEQLLENGKEHSDQRGVLPTYWLHNILRFLEAQVADDRMRFPEDFENLDIILNSILCILLNKDWASFTILKTLALSLFVKLLPPTGNDPPLELALLFKNNAFLEKYLTEGLLGSFLDLQTLNKNTKYERNLRRCGSLQVLNYVTGTVFARDPDSSYVIHNLRKLLDNDPERYFEFMDMFMDDLTFLLNDLFSAMIEIQRNPNADPYKDIRDPTIHGRLVEVIHNKYGLYDDIPSLATGLRAYYLFAVNVGKSLPEFFMNDLVRERFITTLNFSIRVFNSQGETYQPLIEDSLLANLMRIYLSLHHNSEFIVGVKADKNYNAEYFYQTQIRFAGNGLLNGFEKEDLAALLAYLN